MYNPSEAIPVHRVTSMVTTFDPLPRVAKRAPAAGVSTFAIRPRPSRPIPSIAHSPTPTMRPKVHLHEAQSATISPRGTPNTVPHAKPARIGQRASPPVSRNTVCGHRRRQWRVNTGRNTCEKRPGYRVGSCEGSNTQPDRARTAAEIRCDLGQHACNDISIETEGDGSHKIRPQPANHEAESSREASATKPARTESSKPGKRSSRSRARSEIRQDLP